MPSQVRQMVQYAVTVARAEAAEHISLGSAVRSPSIHNCSTRGATVHIPLLFLLESSNGSAIDERTC